MLGGVRGTSERFGGPRGAALVRGRSSPVKGRFAIACGDGLAAALDFGASAASGQPEPRAIVAIVPWTLCVFASRFVLQSAASSITRFWTCRDEAVDAVQHESGCPELQSVHVLVNDVQRRSRLVRRSG